MRFVLRRGLFSNWLSIFSYVFVIWLDNSCEPFIIPIQYGSEMKIKPYQGDTDTLNLNY